MPLHTAKTRARWDGDSPATAPFGKAIGMMMVLNDISDDDAFDILRRTSQDTNVKVAEIAAEIIRVPTETARREAIPVPWSPTANHRASMRIPDRPPAARPGHGRANSTRPWRS
jgi:hypothetical protein